MGRTESVPGLLELGVEGISADVDAAEQKEAQ